MPNVYSLKELEEAGYIQLGRGKIISRKDLNYSKGNYPVYSSSQIGEGKFGNYGKYMFDEELITWSVDGGGKLFHRHKHKFSITNVTGFLRILKKDKVNYKYLYYCLSNLHSQINFDWVKKAHPSVLRKEYNNIPLPSLDKQQKIVNQLNKIFSIIEDAITKIKPCINNSETLFQNYLLKVLKNAGDDWVKNNLKELTSKIGSGSTPRGGTESYKTSGISLIRSMNVHDYGFKYNKLAYIDNIQAKKLDIVSIAKDDVLINITGASVARCCIVPDDVLPARVNQHVSILRVKKNIIIPKLLHYILISTYYKSKLLKIGEEGGATRQAITKTQLQEFVIKFPINYHFQSELIKKINKVENLSLKIKSLYNNKLSNLIKLKQSVLRQKFAEKLIKAA